MLRLTILAKRHARLTHLFIVVAQLIMGALCLEGGFLLWAEGIHLPALFFYLPLAAFIAAHLAYPQKSAGIWESICSWRRRKTLDAVLVTGLALMWVYAGNHLSRQLAGAPAAGSRIESGVLLGMVQARQLEVAKEKKLFGGMAGKVKRWLASRLERKLERYHNTDPADRAGMIVLGVLATLLLGFAILVGACAAACAGNEALAFLVILAGGGLIALIWIGIAKKLKQT